MLTWTLPEKSGPCQHLNQWSHQKVVSLVGPSSMEAALIVLRRCWEKATSWGLGERPCFSEFGLDFLLAREQETNHSQINSCCGWLPSGRHWFAHTCEATFHVLPNSIGLSFLSSCFCMVKSPHSSTNLFWSGWDVRIRSGSWRYTWEMLTPAPGSEALSTDRPGRWRRYLA